MNVTQRNEMYRAEQFRHLTAKVAARNKVNKAANALTAHLRATFLPFVGTKVHSVNGWLLERAKKALDGVPQVCEANGVKLHYFGHKNEGYQLRFGLTVCETYASRDGEHGCACYAETSITIGNLDGVTLKDCLPMISKDCEQPTNYTVHGVQIARQNLAAARSAYQAAEHALAGFGEHDNH